MLSGPLSLLGKLVPKPSPGDYNQALMELGAMICTPKLPKCFVCPVREHCRAVQETNPETLPNKVAKKKPTDVTHVVIAAERNGKYLFEQRPSEGLWSNMWQLPTWEEPSRIDPSQITVWFQTRFGLSLEIPQQTTDFTHQTTHRTIRFVVLRANVASGRIKPNTSIWRKLNQIDDLPMSNPQRQAIQLIDET